MTPFVIRRCVGRTVLMALLMVFLQTDAADPPRNLRGILQRHASTTAELWHPPCKSGYRQAYEYRKLSRDIRQELYDPGRFLRETNAEPRRLEELTTRAQRLIRMSGNSSAEAFHFASTIAFRQGSIRKALRHGARAVLRAPRSSAYHSNFALYLAISGHHTDAQSFYERARSLDPDNTATHVGLLALALEDSDTTLADLEPLVSDWYRRERDPALRETAGVLQDAFRNITVTSTETEEDSADDRLKETDLRRTLRDLFELPETNEPAPTVPTDPGEFFENPLGRELPSKT